MPHLLYRQNRGRFLIIQFLSSTRTNKVPMYKTIIETPTIIVVAYNSNDSIVLFMSFKEFFSFPSSSSSSIFACCSYSSSSYSSLPPSHLPRPLATSLSTISPASPITQPPLLLLLPLSLLLLLLPLLLITNIYFSTPSPPSIFASSSPPPPIHFTVDVIVALSLSS